MSRFRRAPWAIVTALGLSLLLLADAAVLLPGHVAIAAKDQAKSTPQPAPDAFVCAQGFTDIETKAEMSIHGVALVLIGAQELC